MAFNITAGFVGFVLWALLNEVVKDISLIELLLERMALKRYGSDQFPTHGVFFMYKYDI